MGWWKLNQKGIEAWKDNEEELNSEEIEHIAKLIKEGYTEGEIVEFEGE